MRWFAFLAGLFLGPCLLVAGRTPPPSAGPQAQEAQSSDGDEQDNQPYFAMTLDLTTESSPRVWVDLDSSLESKYNVSQHLAAALGCPLTDIELSRDEEGGRSTITADCAFPLARSGSTLRGAIQLAPFRVLQAQEPGVEFSLAISLPDHGLVQCDPPQRADAGRGNASACLYFLSELPAGLDAVQFRFGYAPQHIAAVAGALLLLLLAPVGIALWFRAHARTAPEDRRPAISFAYRRFLISTILFGSLGWWAALDLLRAPELLGFLLQTQRWSDQFAATVVPWVLLWFLALLDYMLCVVLSTPVQNLRGTAFTYREIMGRAFWGVARVFIPAALVGTGVMELFHNPRLGVILVIASFVSGSFATRRFLQAYGIELQSVSSGELRDRAFALADQAKTRLNQLYVFPAESLRMANAFAHRARNIFLTDLLVKNLSKAEVDAVLGHELAHLQKKHIWGRVLGVGIACGIFVFIGIYSDYRLPPWFPVGPFFFGFILLVVLFSSRSNEFAADAGAAKLTGNAEAMITALARISHLNRMPLQWSKLDEKLLTHPSTMRRIRRLAEEGQIPEARLTEILDQSTAPPADTYAAPSFAPATAKIFSTRFKAAVSRKSAWSLLWLSALIPACVAWLTHAANLMGAALWGAYGIGLLFTLAADLALLNYLPVMGLRRLESELRARFRAANSARIDRNALFVSLAPDASPRIYEGNWAWDVGFLALSANQLEYWGEGAGFRLKREEILSLELGPGPATWFSTPALYVGWRDSGGGSGTFNLRPLGRGSMIKMGSDTRRMLNDLRRWHAGQPLAADALLTLREETTESADPPKIGQVTSAAPRNLVSGAMLAHDFLLNTILGVAVIVLFGLGFPMIDDLSSSDSPVNAHPPYGGIYVLGVIWLSRFLLLLPFFKAPKEDAARQGAPATVSSS